MKKTKYEERKEKGKKGVPVTLVKALGYFLAHAEVKTAHENVVGKNNGKSNHLKSTFQRRCCGEQGEKIGTKYGKLKAKAIDHSFYSNHFEPVATMTLTEPDEISNRFKMGGLPAAGNSSDHIYLCVEYKLENANKDYKDEDAGKHMLQLETASAFMLRLENASMFTGVLMKKKPAEGKEENSALEKENAELKKQVKTLTENAAAANAPSVTTEAAKPKKKKDGEKKGLLAKVKNFFYKDDKLDWKTVVPTVGLGLGAVAAVAGAGVSMGVLGPEEKNMSGIAKAGIAAATLAGVGAAGYYGYKNYKAGKDDSEVDDADREVSLGGSGKSKKRHKSKDKKTEKGSNTMLLIFGGLAVLAVLAFLFLGKTEEKSASPLEGDELV